MNTEHVLVCLSSSPTNEKIIRSAAAMAVAFSAKFTALYVENPGFSMQRDDRDRLDEHINLAKQLGARIERVEGVDVAYNIAEFARLRSVTKIVIGRSAVGHAFPRQRSLTDSLLYYAPNLEIHIIPDSALQSDYRIKPFLRKPQFTVLNLFKTLGLLCAASLLGLVFEAVGLTAVTILPVYILAVLIIAIVTNGYIYWLPASFAAVTAYNFLFTDPRYTLLVYDADYPVTFLIMFVVSIIASNLAMRLKRAAQLSRESAHRTKLIFDTDQLLSRISEPDQIIEVTARQISLLTTRDVVYYLNEEDHLGEPKVIRNPNRGSCMDFSTPTEIEAAEWTLRNRHISGPFSDAVTNAKAQYYAIRMNETVFGVVGTECECTAPDAYENSILVSLLGECALAVDNVRNAREKEEAKLRAKNEQLRANLLRSISHDIRTPLTTISGNADSLRRYEFSAEERQRIYSDIYDDALWLNNLVENLLAISKLDKDSIEMNMTAEVMEDVIAEAMKHIDRAGSKHIIRLEMADTPAIVRMDPHLIAQVVINLVNNAIKHTQEGSEIIVSYGKENEMAMVEVRDNGPGICAADCEHIFDMFYTGNKYSSDSRRGMGLGLALCKSIINIHGGTITVEDNTPTGAIFRFELPAEKVCDYE